MKRRTERRGSFKGFNSATVVIFISFVVAVCIFIFVFGNPGNFMNNDPHNYPLPGNIMGTIYKGGIIVPVIQTLLLTVLILSVERWFAIHKASGKGDMAQFVKNIRTSLENNDLNAAEAYCNQYGGSLGNVVYNSLELFKKEELMNHASTEEKIAAIHKDVEESTALELPSLEQNLPVIATMTTLGTLLGLLGTVLGMIKAFAAMATAGSPDTIALSTGISEALVNTAFGIATGALAVISYNYFTSRIDRIVYSIDEATYAIVQAFSSPAK